MIYTRTGDHGTTDLANGERCKKTDDRMEAVGALDELNAHLGLLLCQLSPEISDKLKTETALILRTQRILFAIGAQAVAARRRSHSGLFPHLSQPSFRLSLPPFAENQRTRGDRRKESVKTLSFFSEKSYFCAHI